MSFVENIIKAYAEEATWRNYFRTTVALLLAFSIFNAVCAAFAAWAGTMVGIGWRVAAWVIG